MLQIRNINHNQSERSIMKTIYLQRQGSTHSYNTNNSINSQLGFYIGIEPMRNNKYHITIASRCKQKEDTEQSKTIIIEITAPSLSSVFKHIEKKSERVYSRILSLQIR